MRACAPNHWANLSLQWLTIPPDKGQNPDLGLQGPDNGAPAAPISPAPVWSGPHNLATPGPFWCPHLHAAPEPRFGLLLSISLNGDPTTPPTQRDSSLSSSRACRLHSPVPTSLQSIHLPVITLGNNWSARITTPNSALPKRSSLPEPGNISPHMAVGTVPGD